MLAGAVAAVVAAGASGVEAVTGVADAVVVADGAIAAAFWAGVVEAGCLLGAAAAMANTYTTAAPAVDQRRRLDQSLRSAVSTHAMGMVKNARVRTAIVHPLRHQGCL